MKHLVIFAVAATIAMAMTTMAWSQSGVGAANRQYIGHNSFNDSRIRRQLNLSQDQIRQLRALNNGWRQQLQRFRRGAGNNLDSIDQMQWNQTWQQYAAMVNNVLTAQQQQAWSQLIGQAVSHRTGNTATTTNSNSSAGVASTRHISTTSPTVLNGTNVARNSRNFNLSTSTQQADGGLGSSAVGTARLLGLTIGPNRAGATQAEGGGGSSAFKTALVTGEPVPTNFPGAGATQAQGGGGSSAAGTP